MSASSEDAPKPDGQLAAKTGHSSNARCRFTRQAGRLPLGDRALLTRNRPGRTVASEATGLPSPRPIRSMALAEYRAYPRFLHGQVQAVRVHRYDEVTGSKSSLF